MKDKMTAVWTVYMARRKESSLGSPSSLEVCLVRLESVQTQYRYSLMERVLYFPMYLAVNYNGKDKDEISFCHFIFVLKESMKD